MGMMGVYAQETDARSFVKRYSKMEGFTGITINKVGIRLTMLLAKISNPKDDVSFLSKVNNVQILTLSAEGYEKNIQSFEEAFAEFCKTAGYEQTMQSEDAESRKEIFCKITEDRIVGLIILNKEADSVGMICIDGRFDPQDIESALSGKVPHIMGSNK
jgi:hypothetical protein